MLLVVGVLAGADRSLVLGASSSVRPWSQLLGPGTTDRERTGHQALSTKDQVWFGTWQQVPPQRKWFDPWPYQKVTLRIEPFDDGLRVVYDMVRRRGGITHMEWTGRFDGRDYPVQGVDYVLTNAYRRISDRSYQIVVRDYAKSGMAEKSQEFLDQGAEIYKVEQGAIDPRVAAAD